jgi:hypothetical protein
MVGNNIRTWNEEDEQIEKLKGNLKKKVDCQQREINNIEKLNKSSLSKDLVSKSSVFPLETNENLIKQESVGVSIDREKINTIHHSLIPTMKKNTLKNPVNNIQSKKEVPKIKKNVKAKKSIVIGQSKVISSTPDPEMALIAKGSFDSKLTRKRYKKKRNLRSDYQYDDEYSKKFTPKRYKNRHRNDRYENQYPNYRIKYYPEKAQRKTSFSDKESQEEYTQKYNVKSSEEKEYKRGDDHEDRVDHHNSTKMITEKKHVHQVKSQKIMQTQFNKEKSTKLEISKRESLPDQKKLLSTPISQKIIKNENILKFKTKVNPQSDNKMYKSSFLGKEKLKSEPKTFYSPEKIPLQKNEKVKTSNLPETPTPNYEINQSKEIGILNVISTEIQYPENMMNNDFSNDQKDVNEIMFSENSPYDNLLSSENINQMNSGLNFFNSPNHGFIMSNPLSQSLSYNSQNKNSMAQNFDQSYNEYRDSVQNTFQTSQYSNHPSSNFNAVKDSPIVGRMNRESRTLEHTTRKTSDILNGNIDIRNQLFSQVTQRPAQRTMSNTVPYNQQKMMNKVCQLLKWKLKNFLLN